RAAQNPRARQRDREASLDDGLILFARVITVSADIDRSSAGGSGDVHRGRLRRTARPDRRRSGLQPEVEDELDGIEVDELAFRPAPVDGVVIAIIPRLGNT